MKKMTFIAAANTELKEKLEEADSFMREITISIIFDLQMQRKAQIILAIEAKGLQYNNETMKRMTITKLGSKSTLYYDWGLPSEILICKWDDDVNTFFEEGKIKVTLG